MLNDSPPTQHEPAEPVHDCDQVQEAVRHRNVGDVRAPDLIDAINHDSLQQIGIDLVACLGPAQIRLGIYRFDPHRPHQADYPFTVYFIALRLQPGSDAPTAVKWRPRVLLVDQTHQPQVLFALA